MLPVMVEALGRIEGFPEPGLRAHCAADAVVVTAEDEDGERVERDELFVERLRRNLERVRVVLNLVAALLPFGVWARVDSRADVVPVEVLVNVVVLARLVLRRIGGGENVAPLLQSAHARHERATMQLSRLEADGPVESVRVERADVRLELCFDRVAVHPERLVRGASRQGLVAALGLPLPKEGRRHELLPVPRPVQPNRILHRIHVRIADQKAAKVERRLHDVAHNFVRERRDVVPAVRLGADEERVLREARVLGKEGADREAVVDRRLCVTSLQILWVIAVAKAHPSRLLDVEDVSLEVPRVRVELEVRVRSRPEWPVLAHEPEQARATRTAVAPPQQRSALGRVSRLDEPIEYLLLFEVRRRQVSRKHRERLAREAWQVSNLIVVSRGGR
mmetsp:Transcript_7070/g.23418  ORF Transcript_7070/g.23418 Transcript_7070/m.23418 type:complete len:393 (-) Transcript_7070:69-1247(-)